MRAAVDPGMNRYEEPGDYDAHVSVTGGYWVDSPLHDDSICMWCEHLRVADARRGRSVIVGRSPRRENDSSNEMSRHPLPVRPITRVDPRSGMVGFALMTVVAAVLTPLHPGEHAVPQVQARNAPGAIAPDSAPAPYPPDDIREIDQPRRM